MTFLFPRSLSPLQQSNGGGRWLAELAHLTRQLPTRSRKLVNDLLPQKYEGNPSNYRKNNEMYNTERITKEKSYWGGCHVLSYPTQLAWRLHPHRNRLRLCNLLTLTSRKGFILRASVSSFAKSRWEQTTSTQAVQSEQRNALKALTVVSGTLGAV